jgi:hypothetical protein
VSKALRLQVLKDENASQADADRRHARQLHVERPSWKKMVTPSRIRRLRGVPAGMATYEISQRPACQVIGTDRTCVHYQATSPDGAALRKRLMAPAQDLGTSTSVTISHLRMSNKVTNARQQFDESPIGSTVRSGEESPGQDLRPLNSDLLTI